MISNDITVSLSNWALGIEKHRATLSAHNIAAASSGGIKKIGNFDALIQAANRTLDADPKGKNLEFLHTKAQITQLKTSSVYSSIKLDEEISNLSSASGRYKVIAEAVSRKFGLLNIAARGR